MYKEAVTYCLLSFISVGVINTMTKNYLGEKGGYFSSLAIFYHPWKAGQENTAKI